jgi:Domain of unknown function (DUF4262)
VNSIQQKITSDIQEHGFSMITVGAQDDQLPMFGYTIGLYHTRRLPEIFMIGLSQRSLMQFLDLIAQNMLSGTIYEAGQITTDLIKNDFPCFFATIAPTFYDEYVGQAINYYAEAAFPLLQCVWSDKQRRFPWQPETEAWFQAQQPLLFDPASHGFSSNGV